MATPLTADRMLAALKAEGVKVRATTGWATRERDDETGKIFGPVNGVMIHHTAGRDSLALVIDGTRDLPGPLCHAHLAKNGTLSLISNGRANHAGSGRKAVHDAVVVEVPFKATGPDTVDGNDHFYGLEIENLGTGKDFYPEVQYDQAVRYAAAICRAHAWGYRSVIGHREWTGRKIDPSFSMDTFREAVRVRLGHAASWSPGTSTRPAKTIEQRVADLETRVKKLESGA